MGLFLGFQFCSMDLCVFLFFVFVFVFVLEWGSQARDQIQAAVGNLCCRRGSIGSLTHCAGPGIKHVFQHYGDTADPIAP